MANFWKNAGILTIAELFLKLKALIMMPFITKYLGAVNYGIWSQVMVIVSVVSPLVFCGMENSLARFLPGRPLEEQKKEFTGWLLFGLTSSLLILGLIAISRSWISKLFFGAGGEYPLFVLLAAANVVTTAMLTGIRNWFRIQNQAKSLVFLTILQNIIQMVVLIIILIKNLSIYELVLWSLIADLFIVFGYIGYLLFKEIFKYPSLHWLKPYFRFGIAFLPSGYAVWVLNSLDRVFLAHYHTLADIGIYSICFTIGYTLIQVVVNPIWSLFPTKAAEMYNLNQVSDLNILFNQSIKIISWIIIPSITGLILTSDIILSIVTTDDFAKGYLVIPIILSGYLFLMLSAYFESVLVLRNKPVLSTVFTVIACVTNIILNFALIPKFSYMGAAVATTLSFGMQLSLSAFYALRENVVILRLRPIFKIFLASFCMFALVFLAKETVFHDLSVFSLMGLSIIGLFSYLIFTQLMSVYRLKNVLKEIKRNVVHV